jgi:hypothetical protein
MILDDPDHDFPKDIDDVPVGQENTDGIEENAQEAEEETVEDDDEDWLY